MAEETGVVLGGEFLPHERDLELRVASETFEADRPGVGRAWSSPLAGRGHWIVNLAATSASAKLLTRGARRWKPLATRASPRYPMCAPLPSPDR